MTRDEQIRLIRDEVIEAKYETVGFEHGEWGEKRKEPVRLSDVLLAIDRTRTGVRALIQSPDTLTIERTMHGYTIIGDWNLRADDLTGQSPECISFLADLLGMTDNS